MRYTIRTSLRLCLLLLPVIASGGDLKKGMAAYDVGDYETALAECQASAEAGDPVAQFYIGRLYANGFGVPMDDAQALRWYTAAAEQGHSEAQFNLAVFYANGWGVPMDPAEADKWNRRAADQGFVQAQITLAKNYHMGRGVELNLIEAYRWYQIAERFGDDSAQIGLDEVVDEISPEQLASAQALVQQWLAEHADVVGQQSAAR